MVKRWVGRVAVWWSHHGQSPLMVAICVAAWLSCFIWSLSGSTWWAPALSVIAAVTGVAAARSRRRAQLARQQRARATENLINREIATSLTDEALAWAVHTWRRRYL